LLTEPPLLLDADYISSFAWVYRFDILSKLYADRMLILDEVLSEISRVPHIEKGIQELISRNTLKRAAIMGDEPAAIELGTLLESGRLGAGEAACMAYLKYNPGSLGSNNLADVRIYCERNGKCLITTGETLIDACVSGLLNVKDADGLWIRMIAKKRKLPTATFTEYLIKINRKDLL
jgi:hypothetical protein